MSAPADRISTALECTDCAAIPKVSDAGKRLRAEDDREIQIMHNGLKVYADGHYGSWNCEVIEKLGGHHEPQEEWVFHQVLERIGEGSAMLELGSFWAYYSMWFQLRVAGACNYMIEPVAEMMQVGQDNFALNSMTGDFHLGAVGGCSRDPISFTNWDGTTMEIPQYGVDDFMATVGIDRLGILHADIQGAEFNMLKGARKALKKRTVDYIFISTHAHELHRKCLWLLRDYGYAVIASHTLDESFSVDGLIAAQGPHTEPMTVNISKRKPPLRRLLKHAFDRTKHRLRYQRDLRRPVT